MVLSMKCIQNMCAEEEVATTWRDYFRYSWKIEHTKMHPGTFT